MLALLNHPVTTGSRLALVTGIRGILIAIVAALTWAHDTISAAGFGAIVQTGVVIGFITIIAGFIAQEAFLEIGPLNAIATAGGHTVR